MRPGGWFDFAYVAHIHAPLFARLLGANCVRFEVQRPLTTPGAPPPAYQGIARFWVRSAERQYVSGRLWRGVVASA